MGMSAIRDEATYLESWVRHAFCGEVSGLWATLEGSKPSTLKP